MYYGLSCLLLVNTEFNISSNSIIISFAFLAATRKLNSKIPLYNLKQNLIVLDCGRRPHFINNSPDFTQLPPGHRTCSFIKPSQLPGEHTAWLPFSAHGTIQTQAFTVLPGTHLLLGRESARVSKVPCLGAQHHRSIFGAAEDQTRDLSLVRRARYH